MRRLVERLWVRLLALALFFLFSAGAVLTLGMYRYVLQDGWFGEDFTFAETHMAESYVLDALNYIAQNLSWLEDPGNESLGSYAGDAFAYVVEDNETNTVYADTTGENSYFVTDFGVTPTIDGRERSFRLSGYVNLPVQPYGGCYREYYVFSEIFPLRRLFLPLGIVLTLLSLAALAVDIAGAVRLGKRGSLTVLGRLPFDGAVVGLYIGAVLVRVFLYDALGNTVREILGMLYIYEDRFHTVFMFWYAGLLALILANQLSAGAFLDRLLVLRAVKKVTPIALATGVTAVHLLLLLSALLPYSGFILSNILYDIIFAAFGYSTARILLLLAGFDVVVFLCYIRWNREQRRIRDASAALASGDLAYKVNEKQLHFVWRDLGRDLNSIGDGMALAVEERLRSERMKTELITNVSHDLKTPLTSIINYIELLKREDLPPETQREYLDVLDRQSAKLKKLTEDVIEASKAASGVMPVNAEILDVRELLEQSVGEYAERMKQAGVTPVIHAPEQETCILADGRLLGRVLDNFITNIIKYAQPGTRAYFDLSESAGETVVAVKNTSQAPLDMPADELMERFVRGDSSRSTEGSGLGLSIARSLTELMGGRMRLTLDGDLFKAELIFPAAAPMPKEPEPPLPAESERTPTTAEA